MKTIIKTDVGVVRTENQDRAAVISNNNATLAILCDGMGGHEGGSFASSTTISIFEKEFRRGVDEKKVSNWFSETLKKTKKEMSKLAIKTPKLMDMGTTLTAAIIFKKTIYIFNIGDSRTYAYNGLLHQLTKDHNLRNYYIDKYKYTPEEAAKVMGAMALTSALGPQKTTQVDSFILDREIGIEKLILTSDGVHDYVSKPQFEQILSNEDTTLGDKGMELIKQAIKGKSSDNLTILIVNFMEGR